MSKINVYNLKEDDILISNSREDFLSKIRILMQAGYIHASGCTLNYLFQLPSLHNEVIRITSNKKVWILPNTFMENCIALFPEYNSAYTTLTTKITKIKELPNGKNN